jgi:hypothetical protein
MTRDVVPTTCHHTETLFTYLFLHLGDKSRGLDPDRLVRVLFVDEPIVVAVKVSRRRQSEENWRR